MEGFEKVVAVMFKFYKELLGQRLMMRDGVNPEVIQTENQLSVEQPLKMCAPFFDHDIKEAKAMFSIPNIKSPGPGGYNGGFYKAT